MPILAVWPVHSNCVYDCIWLGVIGKDFFPFFYQNSTERVSLCEVDLRTN